MAANPVSDKQSRLLQFPQSGSLLRTIMESAAVGMALADLDGRITYANRAYAEMLCCRPEECIGLSAGDLVVPEDRLIAAEQVRRLIAGEIEDYRVERRYQRRDGSGWFWGLANAALLRHEVTGQPFTVVIQVVDIDRQKQAEAALADAEGRWNFALEGAGQGVWDHDMVTKRAFFSRTWKTMRGYGPDEDVDGSYDAWIGRLHPDDRERIVEIIRKQNTGEIRHNAFEYRERHKDGHWIWILSRGKPVEWMPDGTPARVIGTDTDISALKEVEAALAEERETLRVTLESIADGVISTDAKGRVTFINPVAAQMTGWQPDVSLDRPVEQIFRLADEEGRPLLNPVTECLAGGIRKYVDEESVLLTRFGRAHEVRSCISLIEAPDGGISGAVLVFQDISRSRAVQRELAHSAKHDGLTGLPNRSAFEVKLAEMRAQARNEAREHALCFIDLDRFKPVNDRAGHAAGDALLREVAAALQAGKRRGDFVARIGGDEFALILSDCSVENARAVAGDVVDAVAAIIFDWRGESYRIGASVGVTVIGPDAPEPTSLLAEADAACYVAKAKGRGRVAVSEAAGRSLLASHAGRKAEPAT
jgi:diguanylate cyclase (GGDEF)-like protein/PAS domain S-box-containing protein